MTQIITFDHGTMTIDMRLFIEIQNQAKQRKLFRLLTVEQAAKLRTWIIWQISSIKNSVIMYQDNMMLRWKNEVDYKHAMKILPKYEASLKLLEVMFAGRSEK